MNINKALEHFKWKFKNSWKPTEKDIEAYNSIIDFKKYQEGRNLSNNESLAKLWINQLIMFSRTGLYDGERSIQVLDSILDKPIHEWCLVLKKELPMMRFGSIGFNKYPLEPKDYTDIKKIDERNRKIVDEFETELTEAMKYDISEDDIIIFVEKQITRVLKKYEYDSI